MRDRAWFRWERNPRRWGPVVIYDGDKPKVPKNREDMFTPAVEAPADCFTSDGSPMFGRLAALFPAPKEDV